MEITGPGASEIITTLHGAGIVMHQTNLRTRRAFSYRATNGGTWELKTDGTVSGHGLELVSPKLRGDVGMDELEKVCMALASINATVDASCGLHVHHDMRNLTAEQIKRQVLAFVERQAIIANCVAPSRRNNHPYTPRWGTEHIAALRRFTTGGGRTLQAISYIGPRGCISLQSYARHGSAEVRFHGGSTNFRKIRAWVRFSQALFSAAENLVPLSIRSIEELLPQLLPHGLTSEDAAVLLRFVRVGETRVEIQRMIDLANGMLQEVSG
jgi:hypothetical protein